MNQKNHTNFQAKRTLILFSFLVLAFNLWGQLVFEKGYFIDNNNQKTECLIKNYEWRLDPTEIEYRLSESSAQLTAGIQDIKEFKVSNFKYLRFTLLVDQSSMAHSNLSKKKEPEFLEETLFLKTILEGRASLFASGKHQRYFYKVDSSKAKQLIYKEYIFDNSVEINNSYKSQLWEDLSCSCITVKDIEEMSYRKKQLLRIFETYNNCVESGFTNYEKDKKKTKFNLSIRPGLRLSTYTMQNPYNHSQNIDFGWQPNFCFGIESELVVPFNKNKWGVIFEPTYQSYYAEDPRENYSNTVDYKSIELPIGIKYKMFISKKSELFLTASVVVVDIPIHSTISSLDVSTTHNTIFGFGYAYNRKFSAEIKYSTQRSLLAGYAFYSGDYQSLSFVLGYNIF